MQHPTSLRLQHPYRFEVHFASIHVNTSKELTEHRSEIFNRNEISCRFEFISPLMWTYSSFNELEYVHMRDKMNSNRYEISFRLNISLRCSVNSLLVFMWTEAKSNSKRYTFQKSIDLFYFWDVYDVNLWEKHLGRSTAYSCRINVFM